MEDKRVNNTKSNRESMVSKEHNTSSILYEKLQLLRSITNSHAVNETSIIVDASKCIVELKEKVERLNQDIITSSSQISSSSQDYSLLPEVIVESLEKGFLINVFSEKSCPGLLVSILEAFEELNLNVIEARASCTENFRLEAMSTKGEEQGGESVDAQIVRQAILQAVRHWSQSNEQDDE